MSIQILPLQFFLIRALRLAAVAALGASSTWAPIAQADELLLQDLSQVFRGHVAFSSQCRAGDELRVLAFPVGVSKGRFFVWKLSIESVSRLSSTSIEIDSSLSIDEAMGGVASVNWIRAQIDSLAAHGFRLVKVERVEDFLVADIRECSIE